MSESGEEEAKEGGSIPDSIVSRAEEGSKAEKAEGIWRSLKGTGTRLGSDAVSTGPPNAHLAAADATPLRELKVQVVFFADGFSVEEEEEEEDAAAAVQAEAAPPKPRRTGVATLRDASSSQDQHRRRRGPKKPPPPLRSYDQDKEFLDYLNQSRVPPELRRLDSAGRPVVVRFGIADARPAACPWTQLGAEEGGQASTSTPEDLRRAARRPTSGEPPEPRNWGAGHSLKSAVADADANDDDDEPEAPTVDEAEPATTLRLRLADGRSLKARLNLAHTVAHLRAVVKKHDPSTPPFDLLAGFPPKKLRDPTQTLRDAGLDNASLVQKLRT